MVGRIDEFFKNESGQGMVEYALIIALIALLLIGALRALRGAIENSFEDETLNQALNNPEEVMP